MAYTKSQRKFYIKGSEEPPTFEHDPSLPGLPVPSLKQSLTRYLLSVKPLVSGEQYAVTENKCKSFESSELAQQLQNLLLERAKDNKNWLHDWWLRMGYLQFREPLIPLLNIAGPFTANNPGGAWPVNEEKPLERVSLFIYHTMLFWKALRKQELRSDSSRSGNRFSMHQFRNLFNSTRIPRKTEDILRLSWCTEAEGDAPTHAVVLRNGHIFSFQPLDQNQEPRTPDVIEAMMREIKDRADSQPRGPGISALTCDFRDRWAENRQHLINLGNGQALDLIETSMFVVALDESRPRDFSEVCWGLMAGNPDYKWADKSLSVIVFDNGRGGINSDHSPMDAMVTVALSFFSDLGIADMGGSWSQPGKVEHYQKPVQLKWNLDDQIHKALEQARVTSHQYTSNFIVKRKAFEGFGKNALTKAKVNPDTFVQMCIQLTYQRLHKTPAATYETATTRQFYQGRTETLRSCTEELDHLCRVMMDERSTVYDKKTALTRAIQRHNQFMDEARKGIGCDRHLFGLYCIALENNLPIPDLFKDPSYEKSGGNGNFILSTSTCGYTGMSGGASAMCQDGYGCFYNFEPGKIWLWITAFRSSYETSVEKFTRTLEQSLQDLYQVLTSPDYKL